MKHFLRIAGGIDATPVLNALANHPELWDENTLRTAHPGTAHAQASDIWVWFNDVAGGPEGVVDDKDVVPYRAWSVIPQLRPLVFDLMRRDGGGAPRPGDHHPAGARGLRSPRMSMAARPPPSTAAIRSPCAPCPDACSIAARRR